MSARRTYISWEIRANSPAKIWPHGTQHGSVARVANCLNVANGA